MESLKSRLPTREQLRSQRSLRFLSHLLLDPNLWHFNRRSVSLAALIGSICCFLPMPFQMIPAAFLCVGVHANVPLAIGIVWISNPLTMPVMFYFAYKVGAALLGMPEQELAIELSVEWLSAQFGLVWQPLLLGSLVCGVTMGLTLFIGIRVYWRRRVLQRWRLRAVGRR